MSSAGSTRPDSRRRLSRARILDGALALLDRAGPDAFSMRRLGEELGVGTMTIYGYFRSKAELLDAIVDAGAELVEVPPSEGPWRDSVRRLFLTIHRGLLEHPGLVELRRKRPLLSPGGLRLTEAGMRILLDAGFSRHEAARAYRALFIYTFGFAAFGPGGDPESEREQTAQALAALPADRFPALAASASEAAEAMADRALFEFGLDRILDGLEQRLARPAAD